MNPRPTAPAEAKLLPRFATAHPDDDRLGAMLWTMAQLGLPVLPRVSVQFFLVEPGPAGGRVSLRHITADRASAARLMAGHCRRQADRLKKSGDYEKWKPYSVY